MSAARLVNSALPLPSLSVLLWVITPSEPLSFTSTLCLLAPVTSTLMVLPLTDAFAANRAAGVDSVPLSVISPLVTGPTPSTVS